MPDPEECLSGHSVQGQSSWVASTRVSAKNQTPGLAARIHHYTEPFIPLHPPTPLVCDTKQWGSVGNFLTLICCIIDHPSPPLSFRPSKVEYPDPKFCPVLSRLIGYSVNCLYCWKFVLKPKCSFPTSFDGQNICVPLQCVKWAPLFNCADHFKSQQSNSRTVVIILNFLGTGKLGDWVNYPAASTCFILNLSGKLSLGPVKDKV